MEFETRNKSKFKNKGVKLKFTPLEFETLRRRERQQGCFMLKFTPLEFETYYADGSLKYNSDVKIYSVGV